MEHRKSTEGGDNEMRSELQELQMQANIMTDEHYHPNHPSFYPPPPQLPPFLITLHYHPFHYHHNYNPSLPSTITTNYLHYHSQTPQLAPFITTHHHHNYQSSLPPTTTNLHYHPQLPIFITTHNRHNYQSSLPPTTTTTTNLHYHPQPP
ncbi:hypothetical protein ElyMa_005186400 [Elysia marginata]|uniref:CTNNB1 binding N-teminal domain-containing protein n=1 Tax=Elysia marginata TaxID=1093978 RepID=A0AAV4JY91_9GAST|nr:hypothetical protein ElyMa_005186400 [Elysia marginata]